MGWNETGSARGESGSNAVYWMSDSVKWVTEWIMPQLTEKTIQGFLNDFQYGNRDFPEGLKMPGLPRA